MKPVDPNKVEAHKIYELFWASYLKGDIETFESTLDDVFDMVGTSENAIFHTKADGVEFLKGKIKDTLGKVEMRNRDTSMVPINGMFLVMRHAISMF